MALIVFLLLTGLLAAFPAAVGATNFVVTNCDDAGPGSLRAAIDAANADLSATAVAPHVITFDLDPACDTITLSGIQLTVANHMEIQGPGADVLTVSGNNASRVFETNAGTATISGLTISGGSAGFGGGIDNSGTLTVTNSTISDNTAANFGGGIASSGTLTVTNSTLSGNTAGSDGGGILNSGTLTITTSAISGNEAGAAGGGIFNLFGTLTVTDSTLSGNDAFFGGGIANFATLTVTDSTLSGNTAALFGGGIFNIGTLLTVTNSTLSGNTADRGGGVWTETSVTLNYSTLTGNSASDAGDNISTNAGGVVTLTASIVANAVVGANCSTDGGAITSADYNLEDTDTCGLNQANDIVNTNPLLGPLQDNGGPTETHALLPGSPAINHIPPAAAGCGTTVVTDQRGVSRPQGAGCDIGAFEVIFVQTYYQACLYAGSLSKVGFIGDSTTTTVNCGRGTAIVLLAGGDVGVDVYYACLYAGSLSKVGTNEPSSCGRGEPISLAAGDGVDDLHGCLYAGSLSQLRFGSPPASCGRGVPISLEARPSDSSPA